MKKKIYVFGDEATAICPQCGKTKTVNVSNLKKAGGKVQVNFKCPCGHSEKSLLERRKSQRKEITLPGIYSRLYAGEEIERDRMVVTELSCSGMRFRTHVETGFNVGEKLQVSFYLNDRVKSLVKKRAVVSNVKGDAQVGIAFSEWETVGPISAFLFE